MQHLAKSPCLTKLVLSLQTQFILTDDVYSAHLWSPGGYLCLGSSVFSKFHQAILQHHHLSCQDCLERHPETNIKHQRLVTALTAAAI